MCGDGGGGGGGDGDGGLPCGAAAASSGARPLATASVRPFEEVSGDVHKLCRLRTISLRINQFRVPIVLFFLSDERDATK